MPGATTLTGPLAVAVDVCNVRAGGTNTHILDEALKLAEDGKVGLAWDPDASLSYQLPLTDMKVTLHLGTAPHRRPAPAKVAAPPHPVLRPGLPAHRQAAAARGGAG